MITGNPVKPASQPPMTAPKIPTIRLAIRPWLRPMIFSANHPATTPMMIQAMIPDVTP